MTVDINSASLKASFFWSLSMSRRVTDILVRPNRKALTSQCQVQSLHLLLRNLLYWPWKIGIKHAHISVRTFRNWLVLWSRISVGSMRWLPDSVAGCLFSVPAAGEADSPVRSTLLRPNPLMPRGWSLAVAEAFFCKFFKLYHALGTALRNKKFSKAAELLGTPKYEISEQLMKYNKRCLTGEVCPVATRY